VGATRRTHFGDDQSLGLIGKRLREDGETIAQEPLPERWVDLIHYLDEQERMKSLKRHEPALKRRPE
jgi:hypothetical protein